MEWLDIGKELLEFFFWLVPELEGGFGCVGGQLYIQLTFASTPMNLYMNPANY